ncbi:MAG: hypothetical protein J7498_11430 [Sphingobium sp.]|nr:hypothetical protein [Sphingobium sp.]
MFTPRWPVSVQLASQLSAAKAADLRSALVPDLKAEDALTAAHELAGEIARDQQLVDAVFQFEQGDADQALGAIGSLLEAQPDWVEGHVVMAQLLSQTGSIAAFELFLSDTIRSAGDDIALVTTCLRLLSEAGRHAKVDALIPVLRARHGDHLFFSLIEAITASETDDLGRADRQFARAAGQGGLLSLPHVRHLIRKGDVTQAATLAEAFVARHPRHQGAWGLLATAWRLTGDSRHDWLVHRPGLVRTVDLGMPAETLAALAVRLRALHATRCQPSFDQSLRGGTQTAGKLFRRDDPELRHLRDLMRRAVRAYIDALPPVDASHPLLGRDRSRFRFTESWSARLVDGGHHVSHVHPQSTISSAFYVTYPQDPRQTGHSGWLAIGEPPDDLRTGLGPLQMIEPKVGQLVLFPSFLWHGTRPFPRGERMTVAFDAVMGE